MIKIGDTIIDNKITLKLYMEHINYKYNLHI